MENKPLVTIMIPVYNREKLIEETLECALNQEFDNYEVVVVDNKSTDKTFEILKGYIKKYKNLRIFQNDENLGPVKNWKVGIEKAQGKYLKILWSDDQISKDFLKKTVPILEGNDEIGFVYTTTKIYTETKENIVYRYGNTGKYRSENFIEAHLIGTKSVPVSPGNALFRLEDVKKTLIVNLENPKNLDFSRYGAGNDLLMFLLTANTYKYFYFIDEVLSFFRAHDGSFSIGNSLEEYYLYSKVYLLDKFEVKLKKNIKNRFYNLFIFKKKFKYMIKEKKIKTDYFFLIEFFLKRILRGVIRLVKNIS